MRFINSNDIEVWANTVDCKYHLPHLIRKLILATVCNNSIKYIQFPYGEDVQTGGYDGVLITELENMFVPLGESIWEFGTTNNKKGKADEDYEKRRKDSLGKIPNQTTYININAKKYRDKTKWAAEKKSEGFWKDVKYIDAIDIEQWLELAPIVELWLAEKLGKPTLGIYTLEEYWKLWSENKSVKIVPEILLGNSRIKEIEIVKSFLSDESGVLYIKSITTDEASVFPLAVFKQLGNEAFNEKIVVIDNRDGFNRLTQMNNSLIVIAKFKLDTIELRGAVQKGHKLIIPLSLSDEVNSENKIQLPIVSMETFENGLSQMAIDREQARILTNSSGRNISVLRRLLKFDDDTKPKYLNSVGFRDIIPILLINRFSEERNGDKEIIEKLSGKTYVEYLQFLRVLATLEDSPVYYINGVWRLVSPTDTWLFFAKYITQQDFENFYEITLEVLSEVLYKYTLPPERRGSYYQTTDNRTKYSSKLREGLCESLVVISVFGQNYGVNSILNVSQYIDTVVQKILEKDVIVWRSLSSNLKLLAEASPSVFLNNLERIIKDKSVTGFFEIHQGFLDSFNDLAPLLWCLDILAWFPQHLMRVSKALCEIIIISPENFPTSNTPLNNLKSIYRTWYPQTNTNADDRKKILEILIKKYPDILYTLLYSLVGTQFDAAFHTSRPKWKLFSELREIQVSQHEVNYMRGFCIDKIIEMSKDSLDRTLSLIDLLDKMDWDRIIIALNTIEITVYDENDKNKIFHKFRKFIGNHRSHHDAHWSLPIDILDIMEQTAFKFKAENNILDEKYLFEENHPEFIEGTQIEDYEKQGKEILSRRLKFVESIVDKYGISKIFELAMGIEHPYLYGQVLALSNKIRPEIKFEVYKLIASDDVSNLTLVREFIRISENTTNLLTQIEVFKNLLSLGISIDKSVNFLISLRGQIDLWKFISDLKNEEIEKLYWKSQNGFLYTENKQELLYVLDKLHLYNKPFTLLNTLGWGAYVHKNSLTSEEVLAALENVSFENFDDSTRFDNHNFTNLLDFLYSKHDYDIERGAKIELKFIFVFTGRACGSKPRNLHKLMSQKPTEYFGILCQLYLPDDEDIREAELQKIQENPNYQEIGKAAWEILNSFNLIPSLQDDGSLDVEVLKTWIDEVRELASKNHRVRVTDDSIGKLLAKYPFNMKEMKGFHTCIYDIIEEGNENIRLSFRVEISNKLGFSTRAAFEGGNIERFKADYFNSLVEETKFTHPNVSVIFANLRDGYLSQAKWEDENALLRSLE